MLSLKLFNAVVAKETDSTKPLIQNGFIIEPNARWAAKDIVDYYEKERLNGNDLNKTFHKSWKKIKQSSRFELCLEQISHYISTYGSNFRDEIYIPDEILDIPDIKLTYKVIKAYTKEEMAEKCLDLLRSGIALKEETINELLSFLVYNIGYTFTGKEGIRNKEAVIKIADVYSVMPSDTMEFFRYIIYRATGQSLLIKNKEMIDLIKNSNFNPSVLFVNHGLKNLAKIFNRFKPLFLAFKPKCARTVNKISRLSKIYHEPIVQNPLNLATSVILNSQDMHWLDNATPYQLFKALSACYSIKTGQRAFVHRIRNGKSWIREGEEFRKDNTPIINYDFLKNYLKDRLSFLKDRKVFLPKGVKYALPTSEKMYVGNIPTGTRFYGKKLAVGIYWENDWGARDLDLSGINIGGKVGWNSAYNQNEGILMYSGDITDAPNGAVEYLYAKTGLNSPTLVKNNVFKGSDTSGYKIIIGKGSNIDTNYMLNPNKLFVEVKCEAVQSQMILGLIIPKNQKQCFVLLNFGAGHVRVSGNNELSNIATKALYQQWNKPFSLDRLLIEIGAEIIDSSENADFNLSIDKLQKDTFVNIFSQII